MFTFVQVSQEKKDLFNNIIANSPFSSVYQSFEWGEVKRKENWCPSRYLIYLGRELVGGFQVLERKVLKFKILYIPRGPVIDYSGFSIIDLFSEIVDYFLNHHAGVNYLFLRISPDIRRDNQLIKRLNEEEKVLYVKNPILHTATFRIDLTKSEQEIFSEFEARTKYDIRKAQKKDIEIVFGNTYHDFNKFYELLKNVSVRQGFPIYSYKLMKFIWDMFSSKGMCQIVLSKYNGKYISGAFLFIFGKKVVYQWGGSIRSQANPNQLMHWEIIKWAKRTGNRIYDFQGIPEKISQSDPLWGVYLFKRGFGGEYVELIGEYDYIFKPKIYFLWHWFEPIYPRLKRVIQKFQ